MRLPVLLRWSLLLLPAWFGPAATAADLMPGLREDAARNGSVEVLIRMRSGPPPPAIRHGRFADRVAATVAALQQRAQASQRGLRAALAARGIDVRAFWVVDALQARVDPATLDWLARRADVREVVGNRRWQRPPLPPTAAAKAAATIEWGVLRVRAPELWALGHTGQGVVIAGQDTGYAWTHPALLARYRGWNGAVADHDHHWHDAVREAAPGNPCGAASPVPCDDDNHGTHTMGTMVGDDGGSNRIGVAPGARWIGCRNMDRGVGSPATYLGCFEWFLAPTALDGSDPDPALAPHIINNSWVCPPSEGCLDLDILAEAVASAHAAGILVVVSAGNGGPACGSVDLPPAIHAAGLAVGASTGSDAIAAFSSRGPVDADGSGRLKPDLVAPGTSVRSALASGGYGELSGTSMAAPHVAGVAALLMGAVPSLLGAPERVTALLTRSAVATPSSQDCPGWPGAAVPNAVFGHGRIDALAALQAAQASVFEDGFEPP